MPMRTSTGRVRKLPRSRPRGRGLIATGPFAPADLVAAVAAEGFRGAGDRYYEVDNSILDRVLRNRRAYRSRWASY